MCLRTEFSATSGLHDGAGGFAIVSKVYPRSLHSLLFILGHEGSGSMAKKPRISLLWRAEDRPWFYGCYSANHDPVVQRRRRQALPKLLQQEVRDA